MGCLGNYSRKTNIKGKWVKLIIKKYNLVIQETPFRHIHILRILFYFIYYNYLIKYLNLGSNEKHGFTQSKMDKSWCLIYYYVFIKLTLECHNLIVISFSKTL